MDNILTYFVQAVRKHPQKKAIADRERGYTFREVQLLAMQTARKILEMGCGCQRIGVFSPHESSTLISFFAVVYSGGCYVPLDPELPAEKLRSILEDADIRLVLGSSDSKSLLANAGSGAQLLVPELQADPEIPDLPIPDAAKDTPLYMVYTSGSTGKPKGVLKSHGAMRSFIETFAEHFSFTGKEIIGNQTPFFFDASAKDIYLMLKTGATLEVIPRELFMMPPKLIRYLNERRVSYICWVPTALSIVTQLNTFQEVMPETLERVYFVGEAMPVKQLNKWRRALPHIQYVNLYGASEIAGISCWYEVREELPDTAALPMGKALPNCQIYLVDQGQVIREPGRIGEIYYASDALALEYFHDPEKTAACFAIRDLGNGPQRTFKTGDLAQYDPNGDLVFAARNDFQIKHMGHRIELGEIESVANGLPEIDRCCCLYHQEKMKITLFCQLSEGTELAGRDVIRLLRPVLTPYMLPGKVIILPQLPLNANGKIDRQKLKQMLIK
ncbi:MAG: amino acid adenylation domain-containing protein [Clostridia bacterium]|nr:amino acid adenylation domain-containing protein [Clostridia bacterium]